jgi:hypothetical protein
MHGLDQRGDAGYRIEAEPAQRMGIGKRQGWFPRQGFSDQGIASRMAIAATVACHRSIVRP